GGVAVGWGLAVGVAVAVAVDVAVTVAVDVAVTVAATVCVAVDVGVGVNVADAACSCRDELGVSSSFLPFWAPVPLSVPSCWPTDPPAARASQTEAPAGTR